MNPIDQDRPIDDSPTDDDARFDLLADGELSELQRRELLVRLDDEPGGWRRCALAFLAAESWKKDLGAIVAETSAAAGASGRRSPPRLRLGGRAGTLMAMAASFLVALLLGWQLQGVGRQEPTSGVPTAGALAANEDSPAAADLPEQSPTQPAAQPEIDPGRVYLVELPGWEGPDGRAQPIRLPAVERNETGLRWLESLPASISPELLQELERAGLRVEQRRELLPLKTNDGRPLVVPVDKVDIHYVGNGTL